MINSDMFLLVYTAAHSNFKDQQRDMVTTASSSVELGTLSGTKLGGDMRKPWLSRGDQ